VGQEGSGANSLNSGKREGKKKRTPGYPIVPSCHQNSERKKKPSLLSSKEGGGKKEAGLLSRLEDRGWKKRKERGIFCLL